MLSTGDAQNYLRKLQTNLRFLKIRDVDYKSLQTGSPTELLKIYHYIFLDYNPLFAKTLLDQYKCDFYGKTDTHFIDTMYKVLRDYFNYKPLITKDQFFTRSFAGKKLQMASDVITLVRQECRNNQHDQKRPGSASARFTNTDKEKKRLLSNVFQPLYNMGLEATVRDEFAPTEQQHLMNNPDESLFQHQNEIGLRTTINHLEEQIQILNVKVENINERLNNIIPILQQTQLGTNDMINLNARLVIVENELSTLRKNPSQNKTSLANISQSKEKQSVISQGILNESDEDMFNSYTIEEPMND